MAVAVGVALPSWRPEGSVSVGEISRVETGRHDQGESVQ